MNNVTEILIFLNLLFLLLWLQYNTPESKQSSYNSVHELLDKGMLHVNNGLLDGIGVVKAILKKDGTLIEKNIVIF